MHGTAPPRSGDSRRFAPPVAIVLALVLAAHFSACGGGSSPVSPTPTPLSAGISASLSPSSPTVLRMAGADPTRIVFELRGAVTFRDIGGGGLQLTNLEVDVVDAAGAAERHVATIDVMVPQGGTASHPLPDRVSLPAGREPLRVRVRGTGRDRDGTDPRHRRG